MQRNVPFLFATASDRKSIPERFKHAQVLNKPVNPNVMAAAVTRMVQRPFPARVRVPLPVFSNAELPEVLFARAVGRTLVSDHLKG